ncbi:MAG: hypothetical protein ABIT01_02215 [Thermoanaerobaculia bacterium]
MSLRSPFVPLAVILLSFGHLVWNGWNARSTVAQNLPNPRVSSGVRTVDLVHETPNFCSIYDLIFEQAKAETAAEPLERRLSVQLASRGRTRILIVRVGSPSPSRRSALLDLVRGRARLRVVADREWIDLGALPAGGQLLHAQVVGILPGPFGFAELNRLSGSAFSSADFSGIHVFRRQQPEGSALTTAPRYRVTVPSPVAATETLARFFFFISISWVLELASLAALALLLGGWLLLGGDGNDSRNHGVAAVCCLISSVVLMHAVLLPPLQGADETSHGATIEALVFRGMPVLAGDPYPRSYSIAASLLDQDRVQFQREEPLPIDTRAARETLARDFHRTLSAEAKEGGTPAPASLVQGVDMRAAFYFGAFSVAGRVLRPLGVLDRISAYRVLSALSGLLLFCAGALLLRRARLDAVVALCYGLVWLVPYMAFTASSISNYATAIGLGSLLAACALVMLLSESSRERGTAAGLLILGSWLGVPVWADFVLLAPIATAVVAIGAVCHATKNLSSVPRRLWRATSLAACSLACVARLARIESDLHTRLPRERPAHIDPSVIWMIVGAVAPVLLGALLAVGVSRLVRLPPDRQRRLTTGVSISLAGVIVLGFLLTPWTSIPYETYRLSFADLCSEAIKVALSNALAWDQDVLFWKFSVGVGGWHDLPLPDGLYAVGRWLAVAALVVLPVLAIASFRERPKTLGRLLTLSGLAASLGFLTLTLRYLAPGNPFARFMLPWFPLLLTPLLLPLFGPRGFRALGTTLLVGVLLHLWIVVDLIGTRYLFGQG